MIVLFWVLHLAVHTKLLNVGPLLWAKLLNSLIPSALEVMGCCLCKQKTRGERTDSPCQGTSSSQSSGARSNHRNAVNGVSSQAGRNRSGSAGTTSSQSASQQSIDSLVMETLDLIRILVDNDMEPPQALITLHKVAERDQGWLSVVKSLIRTIPMDDPLGPAVIILLLDESPLPTKEVLVKMRTSLKLSNGTVARTYREPRYIRNILVILGCLAEKLAGPSSVSLLSSDVLQFLLHNLNPQQHPMVILHSIVALEKFALTRENKSTISTALETMQPNPLLALEQWRDEECCVRREIGFCANWCLDNVFPIANRSYTYENLDLKELNVMLNDNDVSEYLKISPTGLEARCDASSFESVRCTFQVDSGVWYYEVTIITPGVMQIGWATKDSKFLNHEGYGIGDDEFSMAYDGCRKLIWYSAHREPHDHPCWQPGDVLGLLLDVDRHKLIFSLNGNALPAYNQLFSYARSGFFAAASFMSFQQCKFNFGYEPFKFPPDVPFQSFNSHGTLTDDQRVILPRHKKLELLKQITIKEDSCTLCFDNQALVQLKPCNHKGFCEVCVLQLEICPICRTEIQDRDQVSLTSNNNASPAQVPTPAAKSEPRPESKVEAKPE